MIFYGEPQLDTKIDAERHAYGSEREIKALINSAQIEQNKDLKIDLWATAFYEWLCFEGNESYADKNNKTKFGFFCNKNHVSLNIRENIFELYQKRENRAIDARAENFAKGA